jgi:hypothetical protein
LETLIADEPHGASKHLIIAALALIAKKLMSGEQENIYREVAVEMEAE